MSYSYAMCHSITQLQVVEAFTPTEEEITYVHYNGEVIDLSLFKRVPLFTPLYDLGWDLYLLHGFPRVVVLRQFTGTDIVSVATMIVGDVFHDILRDWKGESFI